MTEEHVVPIAQEDDPVFRTETETPTSSPEEKPEDTTQPVPEDKPEDEKPVPFHEDPKIQEFISRQVEKRLAGELETLQSQYDEQFKSLQDQVSSVKQNDSAIPNWFSRIYGEDKAAWQEYDAYQQQERQRIKQEAIAEYESKVSQAKAEQAAQEQRWNKWVDDSVAQLELEGKKFDRNALLKIAHDYLPTDSEGNIDFHKAYDLYEKLNQPQPQSQARKQLAANTDSSPKGEAKAKEYFTPEDLKFSWRSIK